MKSHLFRPGVEVLASKESVTISDKYGIGSALTLPAEWAPVIKMVDTGVDSPTIQQRLAGRGLAIESSDIEALRQLFTDARLTAGPEAEKALNALFAARSPDDLLVPLFEKPPTRLRSFLAACIDEGRQFLEERYGDWAARISLQAALSPHGASHMCGRIYATLGAETWPDVFFLVSPSHYSRTASFLNKAVLTSLGRVDVCKKTTAFLEARAKKLTLCANDPSFLIEHAWLTDAYALQLLAEQLDRPLRIVPIQLGKMDSTMARRLGRELATFCRNSAIRGCLIASGDLTHHYDDRKREGGEYVKHGMPLREIVRRAQADEQRFLSDICQRKHEELEQQMPKHYCARKPLAALFGFTPLEGTVLDHETILNGNNASQIDLDQAWEGGQFHGCAAIAFGLGLPPADRVIDPPRSAPSAAGCDRRLDQTLIISEVRGPAIGIQSRRYARYTELPLDVLPVLHELQLGFATLDQICERLSTSWNIELDQQDAEELVNGLESIGFLVDQKDSEGFRRNLLNQTLEQVNRSSPFYRGRINGQGLGDAPIVNSDVVRDHWPAFSTRPISVRIAKSDPDSYYLRSTSSTSGAKPLRTVVEREIHDLRSAARRNIVQRRMVKVLNVSRPANLGVLNTQKGTLRQRWPALKDNGFSPGINPTQIPADTWDQALDLLEERKTRVLSGDPNYVTELARRAIELGRKFPTLEEVQLGHCFAWQFQREVIARAFGVPVLRQWHSSEFGDMGLTCSAGKMHLLDCHLYFELVHRGGRAAPRGQTGAALITTLDTKLRPLVRYANGDLLTIDKEVCRCGHPSPTFTFEGRLSHLIKDHRGKWVTYRMIDQALGEQPAMRFFRLAVRENSARLTLVPYGSRRAIDHRAIAESLARLLGRSVSVRWADHLELPSNKAKLMMLDLPKNEEAVEAFLGKPAEIPAGLPRHVRKERPSTAKKKATKKSARRAKAAAKKDR
ncbi:MAG: AmmeMemoRadiSam system protein B [Deltaproteobacteria bacterium]|nr:AmmeMemoRadiSam system protein B [Deltaproteobacteria bacterium]